MCVVAPGQDDAPNDESFVGDAPVDEGNEGVGDSNVVGNGTVLILKKEKKKNIFSRCPQVQGGQSPPG